MEGTHQQQQRWRRRPSWWCTLLTQACLCVVLYVALNVGRPRVPPNGEERAGYVTRFSRHQDVYFISVGGGARPLEQQAQLLRQMEDVARTYRAGFVVNLSELGDSDPLMQNVTFQFPSLKVPWYATAISVGGRRCYFSKKIKVPHDRTLEIISLDTGLWQGYLPKEKRRDIEGDQLNWLISTLAVARSNWRLVIGFHSLAACGELHTTEKLNFYEHLHHIFLKYKVDAYLSNHGCGDPYTHEGGIIYIQNHDGLKGQKCRSHAIDIGSKLSRETCDGFHLHRVGAMEIDSYFINSSGDVVSKSTVHQWGREYM